MDEGKCQASVNLMGFAHTTAVRRTKHLYLFTKICTIKRFIWEKLMHKKTAPKSNCLAVYAHKSHTMPKWMGRSVNPNRLVWLHFKSCSLWGTKQISVYHEYYAWLSLYHMSLNMQPTSPGIYSSCLFIVLTCIFLYFLPINFIVNPAGFSSSCISIAIGLRIR